MRPQTAMAAVFLVMVGDERAPPAGQVVARAGDGDGDRHRARDAGARCASAGHRRDSPRFSSRASAGRAHGAKPRATASDDEVATRESAPARDWSVAYTRPRVADEEVRGRAAPGAVAAPLRARIGRPRSGAHASAARAAAGGRSGRRARRPPRLPRPLLQRSPRPLPRKDSARSCSAARAARDGPLGRGFAACRLPVRRGGRAFEYPLGGRRSSRVLPAPSPLALDQREGHGSAPLRRLRSVARRAAGSAPAGGLARGRAGPRRSASGERALAAHEAASTSTRTRTARKRSSI